jgi:hypothetical protein
MSLDQVGISIPVCLVEAIDSYQGPLFAQRFRGMNVKSDYRALRAQSWLGDMGLRCHRGWLAN